MILTYGDCARLQGLDWYILEIREHTIEETVKRIGKMLPQIFREDPVEVFIPVQKRDLGLYELWTSCYIFARSTDRAKVAKMKMITGVVAVASEDDSARHSKFIKVTDDYVQNGLIERCLDAFLERARGIKVGSFVRILDGDARDFCGKVVSIGDAVAVIKVCLHTKIILVETPIHNLLNLSHVPENCQVFYYSEPVQEFIDDEESDLSVLQDDLDFKTTIYHNQNKEESVKIEPPVQVLPPTNKQRTVTAYIKGQIQSGENSPALLLARAVEKINKGDVRMPKNASILLHVLRSTLLEYAFKEDARIKTYRDIVSVHGPLYQVTLGDVEAALFGKVASDGVAETSTFVDVSGSECTTNSQTTVSAITKDFLSQQTDGHDFNQLLDVIVRAIESGQAKRPKRLRVMLHVMKYYINEAYTSKGLPRPSTNKTLTEKRIQAKYPSFASMFTTEGLADTDCSGTNE